MLDRLREVWLPRFLFVITVALAVALAGTVFLSPYLVEDDIQPAEWSRVIRLFALDGTVRKTALASSVGLLVTACVFFRPGILTGKRARNKQPPPVVGA
jgi:hypothetical protein